MKPLVTLALLLAAAPLRAGEAPLPAADAPSPLRWEIGGSYAMAHDELFRRGVSKAVDCGGLDLTAVYALGERHALNLRLGYSDGETHLDGTRTETWYLATLKPLPLPPIEIIPIRPIRPILPVEPWFPDLDPEFGDTPREWESEQVLVPWREKFELRSLVLMPGYRYTRPLTETLSAYAGVNMGLALLRVKCHNFHPYEGRTSRHADEFGLACSAELGLRYRLDERCELFAAYQFFTSTATPRLDGGGAPWLHGSEVARPSYSAIRAGVSLSF